MSGKGAGGYYPYCITRLRFEGRGGKRLGAGRTTLTISLCSQGWARYKT